MRLEFTRRAEKDLLKLDPDTQRRIRSALDRMLINPQAVDLKKLKGEVDLWRLRSGDYRVIMRINEGGMTIYALRVLHRREAYR
ncbi:type II toxin-antitoxin system RelE family toxin [Desulfofalx alkaliphila]|uniref:type II toxin-antitoxin system RelE family toxin n=1 Tax=Desulfofalx alkaliphila TaxID=105483 RepID=UPI0004E0E504|nr:type II toxin-antitoxin system RelE/ParE family toxin [Desulfofalx alkaliphila]